jgi:uncharacterized protein YjbI with pentapeptide repeats
LGVISSKGERQRGWIIKTKRGEIMKNNGKTKITQEEHFLLLSKHDLQRKGYSDGERLVKDGVTFDGLIWRIRNKCGRHPDLEGCEITNCYIEGSDLSSINFESANFKGTIFKNCTFRSDNFKGSHMEGCVFIECGDKERG